MTDQIRQFILKRGNTAVSQTYTGPIGEITYDTDLKTVRVHDGVTPGGNLILGGNVLVSLTNEVHTIEANVANLQANVTSLQANAVSQQTSINTLFANALSQQTQINTLINAPTLGNLLITDETITGLIADRDITLAPSGNAYVAVPALKIPVGTVIQGVSNIVAVITNLTLSTIVDTSTGPGDNLNAGDYGLTNGISAPWTVYQFTTDPAPALQVNDIITGAGIPFNSNVQFVGTGTYANLAIVNTTLYGNAYPPAGTTIFTTRAVVNAGLAITTSANTDITLNPGIGGNIVPASSLIPLVHNVYNLGTPTKRFKELWLGAGTIYVLDETLGIDLSIGARDGNLYVGGAAGLTVGKFTLVGNTIALNSLTEDFKIGTQFATGNLVVNRPLQVLNNQGNVTFQADRTGRVQIYTPTISANDIGALSIIGSTGGVYQPVINSGGMLHITGNDGTVSRITNDAWGTASFPAYISRAGRGTAQSPSAIVAGDILSRYSTVGWGTTNFAGASLPAATNIEVYAKENFTDTAGGTEYRFYTAPIGTTTKTLDLTIDTSGISFTNTSATTGITFYDGTRQTTSANITAINSTITLANTTMKDYVDGQILAANSGVTSANLGMKGYVDNSTSTANVGITGYIDRGNTIVTAGIVSANTGMRGYVDSQVTAANVAWTANAYQQEQKIGNIAGAAVTTINSGTLISVTRVNGTVGINSYGVANVFGTASQVIVTDAGSKNLTLSLPQSIATNSSPTFSNLTVTNLTVTGNLAYTQTGTLTGKNIYLANNSTNSSQIDGGGFYLGNIQQAYSRSFLYNLTGDTWNTGTSGLTTQSLIGTDATFSGNIFNNNAAHFGAQALVLNYPNARVQIDDNLNDYSQIIAQNHSNGTSASMDYVAVNDLGNDSTHYIDMGINSSTYVNANYSITGPNDGYLYVNGGNLVIGTQTAGNVINFFTGNTTSDKLRVTINDSGLTVLGNISASYLNVTNITGNINYANIYNAPTNLSQFTNDTDFANTTYVTTSISAANLGLKGYVDLANTIQSNQINTLTSNAATQSDLIIAINANVASANIGIIGYISLANTIQSNQITNLISNAATQSDLIIAINANVTQANVGMKGYVDNAVTQANVGLKGYVDQSNVAMTGFVNATTVFANVGLKGYVDQQILITSSAAANANVALKGYVDFANTIQAGAISAANLGVIGYVDNAVTTANLGLKGYVDFANTIQAGAMSAANLGIIGYVDFANTIQSGSISLANTTMKGYVDGQISAANGAITTANIGMVGFVQASVFNANAGVIGYVNLSNSSMKSYVDLSNSSMKSYVDFTVNNVAQYSNVQVATYLPTYNGTIGSLTTANTTMKGYVDGQIAAANSAVTTANVGMVGYVQYTVTQANLGIKGYVDSQLTTKVGNVLGTANEITATPSGANVTLSLPNLVIMPGALELAAGNATVTPLAFQSGNLNTIATAGGWEYDGRAFYATPINSERGVARTAQMYMANLKQTMTSTTNVQPLFPQLTRGVNLNSQTRYAYRILGELDTGSHISSTTVSYGLALSGGATIAKHCWIANPCTGTGPQPAYQVGYQVFGNYTANTISPSISNGAKFTFIIDGIIDMITGGNVNPQISFTVSPGSATTLQEGTFMEIWPVGTITGNVNIGNWG